ncbi:MAG TPA: SUF system NifU family Fe-S cluster assembly protein [Ruminococcaceae bacterium]|nr:SUF system NifU family Fe-S cluster assembly protein [Oscillospiraceae bacterium]HCC01550.1 SUF system NifU family Fe-S cluster assembly protein [Oscillospiraceae bacterium]HCM23489.1 SUF system NifU family Fe-S cluster assembly protein [Oscillospiraceae bacterium]
MGLEQIYTQIITENSRSKEHKYALKDATQVEEGVNPSCGDEISLQLRVKDGVIEDAAFLGDGCAISQASASMMIDLIKGKTVQQAKHLTDLFLGMIKGEVTDDDQLEELEDTQAFQNISHMPARVKCAVLGWHTLQDAISKAEKPTESV